MGDGLRAHGVPVCVRREPAKARRRAVGGPDAGLHGMRLLVRSPRAPRLSVPRLHGPLRPALFLRGLAAGLRVAVRVVRVLVPVVRHRARVALDARAHAGLLRPHDARRPRDRRRLRRLRAGRRGARERVLRRERTACVRHARHARGRPLLFVLGLGLGHRRDAGISPAPRPPARLPEERRGRRALLFLRPQCAPRDALPTPARRQRPRARRALHVRAVPHHLRLRVFDVPRPGHDGGLQPEPRRPHLPLRRALVPHADLLPGAERALPTVLRRGPRETPAINRAK
mmetsp:Transcript_16535/g.47077  ORF Transcript_16535/g.47077 Transcript_16535/m.47077 type:complete len:286 (-) Transcript_16535:1-858(-)